MSKLEEISSDATLEELQDLLPELSIAELRKLKDSVESNIVFLEHGTKVDGKLNTDITELRQLKVAIVNEIAHKQSGAK